MFVYVPYFRCVFSYLALSVSFSFLFLYFLIFYDSTQFSDNGSVVFFFIPLATDNPLLNLVLFESHVRLISKHIVYFKFIGVYPRDDPRSKTPLSNQPTTATDYSKCYQIHRLMKTSSGLSKLNVFSTIDTVDGPLLKTSVI